MIGQHYIRFQIFAIPTGRRTSSRLIVVVGISGSKSATFLHGQLKSYNCYKKSDQCLSPNFKIATEVW